MSAFRPTLLAFAVATALLLGTAAARAQLAEFSSVPTEEDFLGLIAPGQSASPGIANRSDVIMREIRDEPALPDSIAAKLRPGATPANAPSPTPRPPASAIALPDVFALGSAELPPRTIAMLDNLAAALARVPTAQVLITGHTDSTGAATFNQGLSERRAQAARIYLAARRGIGAERIQVAGLGARQPIVGLDPAAPNNRRIQIWAQP